MGHSKPCAKINNCEPFSLVGSLDINYFKSFYILQ